MSITDRKIILTILFFILLFGAAQSETFSKYLFPDGKIRNDFSKVRPNIFPNVVASGEKNVFRKNGILKDINFTFAIHEARFGSQDCADAEGALMEELNINENPTSTIAIKEIDKRFSLFFFATNYYLADKNTDTAYFLDGGADGNFKNEIVCIEKTTKENGYGKSSKDAWRFFYKCHGSNGRFAGEPCMTVFDIDCANNKFLGVVGGSFCEDLDRDGRFELIVRDEVYWNINWYWIYRWENGAWRDSSIKFPNYYKTTVLNYLNKLLSIFTTDKDASKLVKQINILKSLISIAEKGGPCCQ